jgi:Na+/proline symporter
MYEMVQNAYKVTMVGALVPLVAGLFWKRATTTGAMASILLGLSTWLLAEAFAADGLWPTQFVGLGFAIVGMVVGSLASRAPAHHAPA